MIAGVEVEDQPHQMAELGFVMFDWMSRGQQLSVPMIVGGIAILVMAYQGRFGNRGSFA